MKQTSRNTTKLEQNQKLTTQKENYNTHRLNPSMQEKTKNCEKKTQTRNKRKIYTSSTYISNLEK